MIVRETGGTPTPTPNRVEPVAYLAATMTALITGHPMSRIDELMPWHFQLPSSEDAQAVG